MVQNFVKLTALQASEANATIYVNVAAIQAVQHFGNVEPAQTAIYFSLPVLDSRKNNSGKEGVLMVRETPEQIFELAEH